MDKTLLENATRVTKRENVRRTREERAVHNLNELQRKRLYNDLKRSTPKEVDILEQPVANSISADSLRPRRCLPNKICDTRPTKKRSIQAIQRADFNTTARTNSRSSSPIRTVGVSPVVDDMNQLLEISNGMSDMNLITNNRTLSTGKKVENFERQLKIVRAREDKLRREIKKLNKIVNQKDKEIVRWKRKYYRALKKPSFANPLLEHVKKIEAEGKKAVRKELLCSQVLKKQLLDKKIQLKTHKERIIFSQIIAGKVIKKYKKIREFGSLIDRRTLRKYKNQSKLNLKFNMNKRNAVSNQMTQHVQNFLEQDENSIIAPGARDTITLNKLTKRKRFLNDTMDNLFVKFAKTAQIKISRATFYRCKPFWIVARKDSDRDTCMCKIHSNMKFLLQRLTALSFLKNSSSASFIKSRVCAIEDPDCSYRKCHDCMNKLIPACDNNDPSWYFKWVRKHESRKGLRDQIFNVNFVAKEKISCTVKELVDIVNSETPEFLRHAYNTGHQLQAMSIIKDNLKDNGVFIVVDFSENFTSKYAEEIQAVHFGASKKQISLHTGVIYFRKSLFEEISCVSFCTVSDILNHDAATIWAHLEPIIKLVKELVPNLTSIHFRSDGPTTQYKNKTNFYLFHHHCQILDLTNASWNFTTSGHGKSVADGSGGDVKVLCDRAVRNGTDILSAQDIVNVVSTSNIKIYPVDKREIDKMEALVKSKPDLKPAPHSNQIFQITYTKRETEFLRLNSLSCSYCLANNLENFACPHFGLTPNVWYPEGKRIEKSDDISKESELEMFTVSNKKQQNKKSSSASKDKNQSKKMQGDQSIPQEKKTRAVRLRQNVEPKNYAE